MRKYGMHHYTGGATQHTHQKLTIEIFHSQRYILGIIKKLNTEKSGPWKYLLTVFPHIRPAGIIISHSLQMRVLLELRGLFEGGSYKRKYGV